MRALSLVGALVVFALGNMASAERVFNYLIKAHVNQFTNVDLRLLYADFDNKLANEAPQIIKSDNSIASLRVTIPGGVSTIASWFYGGGSAGTLAKAYDAATEQYRNTVPAAINSSGSCMYKDESGRMTFTSTKTGTNGNGGQVWLISVQFPASSESTQFEGGEDSVASLAATYSRLFCKPKPKLTDIYNETNRPGLLTELRQELLIYFGRDEVRSLPGGWELLNPPANLQDDCTATSCPAGSDGSGGTTPGTGTGTTPGTGTGSSSPAPACTKSDGTTSGNPYDCAPTDTDAKCKIIDLPCNFRSREDWQGKFNAEWNTIKQRSPFVYFTMLDLNGAVAKGSGLDASAYSDAASYSAACPDLSLKVDNPVGGQIEHKFTFCDSTYAKTFHYDFRPVLAGILYFLTLIGAIRMVSSS